MVIFGIMMFLVFFGGILYANAKRWRYLAQHYSEVRDDFIEKRSMQDAILVGMGAYNTIKGILTIGVCSNGISLRLLPPFSLFHSPLHIPFSDIQGWGTSWYLNDKSTEIQLRNAPDVKIIMPTEQVKWIDSIAGGLFSLTDENPPEGKAGRGAYAFVLINAAFGIIMVASMIWFLFSGKTV